MSYNKIFNKEDWALVNKKNKEIMDDYIMEYTARKKKASTIAQYKNDLRIILIYVLKNCDNKVITELSKRDFRNLSLWFSNDLEVSNARTNRLMSCCRSFMTFVEDEDDYGYEVNQAAKIKGLEKDPVRDIVFLEDSTIMALWQKLMDEGRYKMATLVGLAYDSGARKGELAQVTKDSITDDRNATNIVVGKRGKKFPLLYFRLTKEAAKKYFEERGEDDVPNLFVDKDGTPTRRETLYDWVVALRDDIKEITGKDIPVNVHTFRHCFIQNLSDSTHYLCREMGLGKVPIEKIKLLVHHTSSAITESYKKDNSIEEIQSLFGINLEE